MKAGGAALPLVVVMAAMARAGGVGDAFPTDNARLAGDTVAAGQSRRRLLSPPSPIVGAGVDDTIETIVLDDEAGHLSTQHGHPSGASAAGSSAAGDEATLLSPPRVRGLGLTVSHDASAAAPDAELCFTPVRNTLRGEAFADVHDAAGTTGRGSTPSPTAGRGGVTRIGVGHSASGSPSPQPNPLHDGGGSGSGAAAAHRNGAGTSAGGGGGAGASLAAAGAGGAGASAAVGAGTMAPAASQLSVEERLDMYVRMRLSASGGGHRAKQHAHLSGVTQRRDKWEARLRVANRVLYLGRYSTRREAEIAFSSAAFKFRDTLLSQGPAGPNWGSGGGGGGAARRGSRRGSSAVALLDGPLVRLPQCTVCGLRMSPEAATAAGASFTSAVVATGGGVQGSPAPRLGRGDNGDGGGDDTQRVCECGVACVPAAVPRSFVSVATAPRAYYRHVVVRYKQGAFSRSLPEFHLVDEVRVRHVACGNRETRPVARRSRTPPLWWP